MFFAVFSRCAVDFHGVFNPFSRVFIVFSVRLLGFSYCFQSFFSERAPKINRPFLLFCQCGECREFRGCLDAFQHLLVLSP